MSQEYTEAQVTYYAPDGRYTETFSATSVVHQDGALKLYSDKMTTIVPLTDLVGSVVLR